MSKTVTGGNTEKKDDIVVGNTIVKGSRVYEMISTKGFQILENRKYGKTVLSFAKALI